MYCCGRNNIRFFKKRFLSAQPIRYLNKNKKRKIKNVFAKQKNVILFEGNLNCICTQVNMKLNIFKQNIMYPIQNYVQTSLKNCLFPDKFSLLS